MIFYKVEARWGENDILKSKEIKNIILKIRVVESDRLYKVDRLKLHFTHWYSCTLCIRGYTQNFRK